LKVLWVALGVTVRSRGLVCRPLIGIRAPAGGEVQEFTQLAAADRLLRPCP